MLQADLQLLPHHVISLREDILIINEALATFSKRKGGRAIKEDRQTRFCQGVASAAATDGESSVVNRASASDEDGISLWLGELVVEGKAFKIVIESTFVTVKSISTPWQGFVFL